MKLRPPGDDIRGVGQWHSRVHPANQAEMDRLHEQHGQPAPWHATFEPFKEACEVVESRAVRAIRNFLRALIEMSQSRRNIFFARLQGMEWRLIGQSIIGNASPQAAQKEFAATIKDHPALKAAFPELNQKEPKP